MENNIPDFRNPQVAFESAISKGIFTEEHAVRVLCNLQKETNFVGDWMYMHSDKTKKSQFNIGSKVIFGRDNGKKHFGTVEKINISKAVVKSDEGVKWNVPFNLMQLSQKGFE